MRAAVNGTSLGDELTAGILSGLIASGAAGAANGIGAANLNVFASGLAHALAGCVAGAASGAVNGGNAGNGCSAGAIGAVAGELAATFYNPDGDLARGQQTVAFAQVIAGIAGGITGQGDANSVYIASAAGGNAVANNRLLHPAESTLAEALAKVPDAAGHYYTADEIRSQMRLMGNDAFGSSKNSISIIPVANTQEIVDSFKNDPTMQRSMQSGYIIELSENTNPQLQNFIIDNTRFGSFGNWIPGSSPYQASASPISSGGSSGNSRAATAGCAYMDLSCISGVGANQNPPLTQAQKQAVGAYFGQVSTDYQRAAALAAATGNSPFVVSFEIGAAIAGILEQMFNPSVGKILVDTVAVDLAAKAVSERTGIPLAIVNEIAEREIKPRLQNARQIADNWAR